VRNKVLQQQQQQHALGMGRPGQPMTAQMAQAMRQASAHAQGGFVHPNGVTGYPQGMTPQQQQYLQHQHLMAAQQQQNAAIARPASAAPQAQQQNAGLQNMQQRYMPQQSQSPASPAMTARSGVIPSQLPSRQQSVPVGIDGSHMNGHFFMPGSVQHGQQQQQQQPAQVQQQNAQIAPSPHLGAQQLQQQKMLVTRNPNGVAARATTPLQQQTQAGQPGYPQPGPGPMQSQVPPTPQTMQLQAEQRARLVAQQQHAQAQQQHPNMPQRQFLQQQQQQATLQHAQNQQAMQRQMDQRFASFGYPTINIQLMAQALSATNMEQRNPENMSQIERVSLRTYTKCFQQLIRV
jgi:hypothetical protein